MQVLKDMYRKFSSMKTGLILLVSIGLVSALGSGFLPDSFPQTALFRLLLLLLFINMVLCTASQSKRFVKRLRKMGNKSWSWMRQTGILLLHAGIILVLIGGAINSYYGETAKIAITEGETFTVSKMIGSQEPFKLKLDRFKIELNDDGSPSQYYSKVRIIKDSRDIRSASISVNHPLKFGGVKFYQESYGHLAVAEAVYAGKTVARTLREGEFIEPQGTARRVKMFKYIPDFDPEYGMETKSLSPDNPRVIFSVYNDKNLLGIGAAKIGEKIEIDEGSIVKFTAIKPYTVLSAKTDPGLPLTGTGGVMLMLGVCLALFMAPPRKPTRADSGDELEDISTEELN